MTSPTTATRFSLLRALFDLAREQRRVLEAGAFERYQALLQDREDLIGQLQDLATEDQAMPSNVIAFPGTLISDEDDDLALDTLIRGILEHDRQNEAILAAMLAGVGTELQALDTGQRQTARYGLDLPRSGFIDRVS